MGLGIFFSEDVARILNAIEETAGCFPPSQFTTGWLRCLAAVRVGFGLQHGLWEDNEDNDEQYAAEEGESLRASDSQAHL